MRERNPANPGQRFDWMGFQCNANLNVHLTVSSAQVEITAGLVAWPIHRPWVLP
jgi:hypothetical protein